MGELKKTIRDGNLSITAFENKDGDKVNYSYKLQKSYKPQDSEEWVNKDITLFKEDLLRIQTLLDTMYKSMELKKN